MFTLLASSILPTDKLVTVVSPREFNLRLDDGRWLLIPSGTFEAPVVVADHPYSAANGLHRYAPKAAAPETQADSDADPADAAPERRKPGRPRKVEAPETPTLTPDTPAPTPEVAP